MTQIRWNTDVNAPCCPGEIVADDGRTVLVQTDWDYCGVASTFGWCVTKVQLELPSRTPEDQPVCAHLETDGTVDCPDCGLRAGTFMAEAGTWLRDHHGATAEDPGYFEARKDGVA